MNNKFKLLHLALYAKGWYKRFNPKSKRKTIWDDIRQTMIGDDYSGEFMTKHDMVSVILNQCQKIQTPSLQNLSILLTEISEENIWKYGYRFDKYDYWEAILYYCLSNIRMMSNDDYEPLPSPDPKVLPLAHGISLKKINQIIHKK